MALGAFGDLIAQFNNSLSLTQGQFVTPVADNAGRLMVVNSGIFAVQVTSTLPLPSDAARDSTFKSIMLVGPGSSYSGTTSSGVLSFGSVTTAPPAYATGQVDPLSLTTSGLLRINGSYPQTTGNSAGDLLFTGGAVTTAAPSYITGTMNPLSLDTTGNLRVTMAAGTLSTNLAQIGGVTVLVGNGVTGAGSQRVTIASDSPLQPDAARDSTLKNELLQQPGAAFSTNTSSGVISFGSVSTNAPSYTTGQVDPISLTTSGLLRVDATMPQFTGTAGQDVQFMGGAVTTATPTYPANTVGPFSLDTSGNLRTSTGENGTGADLGADAGNAGDGNTPITSAGFTDLVTIAVGAGVIGYITGFDITADCNAVFQVIVQDGGVTLVNTIRVGMTTGASPSVIWTFPRAITVNGAATRNIKLQAKVLNGTSGNAGGGINMYTRP